MARQSLNESGGIETWLQVQARLKDGAACEPQTMSSIPEFQYCTPLGLTVQIVMMDDGKRHTQRVQYDQRVRGGW